VLGRENIAFGSDLREKKLFGHEKHLSGLKTPIMIKYGTSSPPHQGQLSNSPEFMNDKDVQLRENGLRSYGVTDRIYDH
jgi:hypothetical protein